LKINILKLLLDLKTDPNRVQS